MSLCIEFGNDRGDQRCGDKTRRCRKYDDNPRRFLASAASVGIRLGRASLRRVCRSPFSLRMNRPELDAISFSLYSGHIDRPGKWNAVNCVLVTTGAGNELGLTAPVRHTGAANNLICEGSSRDQIVQSK